MVLSRVGLGWIGLEGVGLGWVGSELTFLLRYWYLQGSVPGIAVCCAVLCHVLYLYLVLLYCLLCETCRSRTFCASGCFWCFIAGCCDMVALCYVVLVCIGLGDSFIPFETCGSCVVVARLSFFIGGVRTNKPTPFGA